jgi:hypothetical protein
MTPADLSLPYDGLDESKARVTGPDSLIHRGRAELSPVLKWDSLTASSPPREGLSEEWVTWPAVQSVPAHSTMPFICPIQNASLACSDMRSDGMRFSLTALP